MLFLSEPNEFYLQRVLFLSSTFRTHVKKPGCCVKYNLTEEVEMGCGEGSLGLFGQPL